MPTRVPTTEPRGRFPQSSFKYNPLQHIRFLYTVFVQGLFYAAPRGAYHWEQNEQDTEIIISAESPLKLTSLNDRPGITFTRSPIGFRHLGFDDMLKYDFATGQKMKGLLLPGTMVINCCSRVDLESENLAWIVAEHLWLLRDRMMQQGFYEIGRNLQVLAPTKPGSIIEGDGGEEWFCTSVISPFQFQRTSVFTPLGQQLLQHLQLNMHVEEQPPLQPGVPLVPPNGPTGWPFQVDTFPPAPFAPGAGNPNIRTPQNPGGLPLAPHPLDPSRMVVVRPVRADQPGVRPPSIYGQVLPIPATPVTESGATELSTTTVKV